MPTTACQPLNLFGQGAPSRAALDYVLGTSIEDGEGRLDVGAISLRGEPFSLWAGPVSVAFGGEIRRTSLDSVVDALSRQSRFSLFNPAPLSGSVTVKEAFGEVLIPLVKDVPLLQLLEINGATRVSDYSTSGTVWSWKVGATNRLVDGWRVRGVISRDIRAPNVTELFTTRGTNIATVNDPFRGNANTPITSFFGGNPDLRHERSLTYSVGTIFEPSFAPGLSASVDFYNIDIKYAITTQSASGLLTRCFAGSQLACNAITRDPPGPGEAIGPITQIRAAYINLNRFETKGIDFELAYRMPANRIFGSMPGSLQFRLLGNWVDTSTRDDGLVVTELAGNSISGVPHWRAVGSVSYASDNLGLDLRGRYVGGGLLSPGQNVTNNQVDAALYLDLGFRFGVPIRVGEGSKFEFFGSVTNLLDKDSPPIATTLFDPIGRFFNVGARVRF